MVSYNGQRPYPKGWAVLILIVMDNGLLLIIAPNGAITTVLILIVMDNGLLPRRCCWQTVEVCRVLILIVMDNGLLPWWSLFGLHHAPVLILIVMDNGLLLRLLRGRGRSQGS